MLDPVCNVPISGESRETKDWPPEVEVVQRLPVPRLHPKQGCQAQIANQIDKGRILQDRRLPLSSPKGQNHLG